ncbi:MAG TPA: FGGY-family carbohydrate kinase [Gemmatimonadales bacterium]|nr:FGGY-family carbohydrate kinase [Gemmatimonadales bacterium]
MAIYVGFDVSTQSLTAIAIDVSGTRREVVFERSLGYDADFPAYGTTHGVLPREDPLVATSSPLMWAEALDRMMGILGRESGLDLAQVRAVSGSGQQHGSVYLNAHARTVLAGLDAARPLVEQLGGVFTRKASPIWMDSSTARQCEEITRALGGAEAVSRLTGSVAFERFTGPQIRKFHEYDPASYKRTAMIHLVSSYGASLLAGRHAPIDPGDGAGMSLMDLARRQWSPAALAATAPDLLGKLPPLAESWSVVGSLAEYWRRRHGLPAAKVVAWSGDNPCSLVGVGLAGEGEVAISLGTSDTLFGTMREARTDPTLAASVFGAPTGDYMALLCFKNGSLARERVRDAARLDWPGFSRALRDTRPGNRGALMLPWFEAEITPNVLEPGVRRYGGLEPESGPANVRAVVEGQMMALATHSRWMGVEVREIRATGGAAANAEILQVMADVHGAPVRRLKVGNSACLGAALRAYHADELSEGRRVPWKEIVSGFVEPEDPPVQPTAGLGAMYAELTRVYAACEAHALGKGPEPVPLIAAFRTRFGT